MQTKEVRRDAPRASEDAEALVLGGCKRSLGRWFGVGRVGLEGPEGELEQGHWSGVVQEGSLQTGGPSGMNLESTQGLAWWSRGRPDGRDSLR